jgi:hypothetical protein
MITGVLLMASLSYSASDELRPVFGPFHAQAGGSGPGHIAWFDGTPPTESQAAWTISVWVKPAAAITRPVLTAGFGDGIDYIGSQRFFAADSEGWFFWYGGFSSKKNPQTKKDEPVYAPDRLKSGMTVKPGWQHLAAAFDGKILHLYIDGRPAGQAEVKLTRAAMQVLAAPPPAWKDGECFEGKLAEFQIWERALDPMEITELAKVKGKLDTLMFIPAPAGTTPTHHADAPAFAAAQRNVPEQPADTLPGPVPNVEVKRVSKLKSRPYARPQADGMLLLDCGWEMADAGTVKAAPEQIASSGFDTATWYDATVPGTALTTLVNQGVYPEPTHGLNNRLIPDLATKSWWYRVEFPTAHTWKSQTIELLFKGINYRAEAWLNGKRLGEICGAFIRGPFDITSVLSASGDNVLAVRVWPQPHYTQGTGEASVKFGTGGNGCDALLDGPAFFCTEGWDWIPTTRDRCTGIWQDVLVRPVGPVTVDDPQVITKLPNLPDLTTADITIKADLRNVTQDPQTVSLEAALASAACTQKVSLAPGQTMTVEFTPAQFPQLSLKNPQLWWPVSHGQPVLHDLSLRVVDSAGRQSARMIRKVGLRQVDYDYLPKGTVPGIGNTPFYIKVNGRKIFVRGGNWGLDDIMKRSSTERLEPYFRLHRQANLNMIRNWCGQNTQDNFYELADRYGLMVWNDFWLSTGGYNLPAIDAARFMANAKDTIRRCRYHPSIVVWCGRNEGTPPDWLNTPLDEAIRTLDGTRIYIPDSRGNKLMPSGPWMYNEPRWYFTDSAKGFNTELGINSIPTADAIRAMLDPSQQWPWDQNDAWAYHDFAGKGFGEVKLFREAAEKRYGKGQDLEGFVKRMQMQNYTHHRVMLEAFNSKMWQPATGILLWMSHSAWPSMVWQLYTSDYETHASYFGVKKAAEPVHVQWNLDDDTIGIVNSTHEAISQAVLKVCLVSLDGKLIKEESRTLDISACRIEKPMKIVWADYLQYPVQFLKLQLHDSKGSVLSDNFYWACDPAKPENLQALQNMPQVNLEGKVTFDRKDGQNIAAVQLNNRTSHAALMVHAVLRDAASGRRILPAYASDNYVSLLPGETRIITITCSQKDVAPQMIVTIGGWNIVDVKL